MNSPSQLDDHLGFWLRRVSNHVSAGFAKELAEHCTSIAEWVVLRHLFDLGETSPTGLAETVSMTAGAITKVVDKLLVKGWVEVRERESDRRGRLLTITKLGRDAVPILAALADDNDRRAFGVLSEADQVNLRHLLTRYTELHNLTKQVPTE